MLATHPPTLTGTRHITMGKSAEELCAAIHEYWMFGREKPSEPLSWDLVIIAQALAEEVTRRAREES